MLDNKKAAALRELKNSFKNPSSECRFAPFWFLNHDLTHDEIKWQINQMHEQGVGGFILHGRFGLITLYMSDEWMDICETAIKEAEKLGMKAYLYDENDFVSGTANGKVTENPEFRHSGIVITGEHKVDGSTSVDISIDSMHGLIAVLAVPADKKDINFQEDIIDLTGSVKNGRVVCEIPQGQWQIIVFAKKVWHEGANQYALDYMNPKAVARFIELTHEPYRKRFGKYFGNVIEGIFLDEPAVNYVEPGVPWTGALPVEFDHDHGYELAKILPALFKEFGPSSFKPRCDFWETVGRLYADNYFAQVEKFCDKWNLKSVGHVSCEGELFYHTRRQVDFFRCGKHMHFGGMDFLSSMTWPIVKEEASSGLSLSDVNNHLTPKMASSVAHLYGKPRVMSEAFGHAGQWGVTLRELKRLTDWHLVLGANLLMPHAFYYSISGFRRWESPPGETYQSTFWPYYWKIADYAGRLCSVFSGGQHIAKVAVLYPVKSMWTTNMSGSVPDKRAGEIIQGFTKMTMSLTRAHHDFDVVPEELIQETEITDTIQIRDSKDNIAHQFEVLVIPPCTTLSRKTLRCVERFYDQGGTVVFSDIIPDSSAEQGLHPYPAEVISRIFGGKKLGSKIVTVENDKAGRAVWIPKVGVGAGFEKQLADILDPVVEAEVSIVKDGQPLGDIVCYKYKKGETDFYMLVNTSEEPVLNAKVKLTTSGQVELWDAESGQVTDALDYKTDADNVLLDLSFGPVQSYVISVSSQQEQSAKTPVGRVSVEDTEVLALPDSWGFSAEKPNVLPLTDWRMTLGACAGIGSGMQTEVVENPDLCRSTRRYQAGFKLETELKQAKVLFDGLVGQYCIRPFNLPFTTRVKFNDTPVEDFGPGEYLDHFMKEAEIGHLLKSGANELSIDGMVQLYDGGALGHPVLLLGDFCLEARDGQWVVIAAKKEKVNGSWTEFGYPFYSGIGTYSQNIEIPKIKKGQRYAMQFESVGDLAEVIINDKSAGVVAWEPWELDITECVKPGENKIQIKIANSLQNLLVLTPRPSGLIGKVKIISR